MEGKTVPRKEIDPRRFECWGKDHFDKKVDKLIHEMLELKAAYHVKCWQGDGHLAKDSKSINYVSEWRKDKWVLRCGGLRQFITQTDVKDVLLRRRRELSLLLGLPKELCEFDFLKLVHTVLDKLDQSKLEDGK